MKKFEYDNFSPKDIKGFMSSDDLKKKLNELGDNGWELVGVTVTNYGGETFYFKREKLDIVTPIDGD